MFDLEQAIGNWRQRFATAGMNSPGVLDELEAHLREDIDRQVKSGLSVQQAFVNGLERLGEPEAIKAEFNKTRRTSMVMEKFLIGICGLVVGFGVFLSVASIILCFSTWTERAMAALAVSSILLVLCTWRYAVPFLPLIPDAKWRWVIGLACIASGFIGASFFCNVILPHFEISSERQRFEIALWAVFLIAVFFCSGVGLLMSESQRNMWGMTKSRLMLFH